MPTPPDKLRTLLSRGRILTVPACFDAYSAHLAERAGFPATFMSGFSVAATRPALPDTGLISYGEMVDQGRRICEAVSIPVLGDGDTGYGNAMNIRRTVEGYARAGFANTISINSSRTKEPQPNGQCTHQCVPVPPAAWPGDRP